MGRQIPQWLASLTCTISVAMTGTCYVWTAPLLIRLTAPQSPLPMSSQDASWISSFIEIGEFVSTVPAGLLADRFGRKTMVMCSAPIVLLGWILTATTRSLPVLYFVRFLHGISIAISFTIAPMYLAEVAEPKIRGVLSSLCQSMWYLGCLYVYVSGPYLSYNNYVYVCAVVPIVSTILFFFVPESPYYYFMNKEEDKAKKALIWLRGGDNVTNEYLSIKASVEQDMKQKGSWRDLFATQRDRKSFLIVQFVCVIKYLSGMSAIMIYATQTFEEQLKDILGSNEMTIILGVILFLATFLSSFMIDKVGRKPLLIVSSASSSLCNMIVAVFYYLDSHTDVDVSSCKWISFAALIVYSIMVNIGLAPLMQTIQAEYFPSHTRGIGGGITEMFASLGAFVSVIQYQVVSDYFGTYMNYVIFSLVSLIGTITFAIVITETAGKSLGQIQDDFEKKNKNENDA